MNNSYQSTLDWLYNFVDYESVARPRDPSRYDLRRVSLLLEKLGHPHLKARTVHIAGSKGKGSTAAMVFSALRQAGFKTGLYTSPHLIETTERFKIGGRDITEAEFTALVETLKPLVLAINVEARYGLLTTFEIMTVLAFAFFAEQNVEWQVIEVGLGGRLDATNVVSPEVSVITTINLEHTEVLGNTLPEIAAEKAGIVKPGVPVVTAPQPKEVMNVIEAACRRRGSPLRRADMTVVSPSRWEDVRQLFSIGGRLARYDIDLPLLATYQRLNATVAVAALETLIEHGAAIEKDHIERGLAETVWPGRFQIVRRDPLVILDGAHNPAAARELVDSLHAILPERPHPAVLVIGASSDKDIYGMADILRPEFSEVVVTKARHPRSMDTKQVGRSFEMRGMAVNYTSSVAEALALGVKLAGSDGLVCVTGSLFVVGEALASISQ
ncbi:folylpolyglutamate synthase/dihydrofolate synthase family protein [Dehalogenimonas sp. THU2]|uniref:bifunctional folylpolyglutamate synthase/dihydrofolate synthase n=1 Tax=Dehalogenimonas sp. THU2 TaxID=3151121 RepID=UPI003218129C